MPHDTLDEAILYGDATEAERCEHLDCGWCHPPVAPDVQARSEVQATLNPTPYVLRNACTDLERENRITTLESEVRFYRGVYEAQGRINAERLAVLEVVCQDLQEQRDTALKESGDWEALYSIAVRQVLELREDVREAETAATEERGRSGFLESALRHYAEHAWNDIKRMLEPS